MVLSSGSTLPSRSLRIGSYGGPCKQSQQRVNTCVCGLAREPRPQWCSGTCGRSAQSSGCLRRMRTSCPYEHFFGYFLLELELGLHYHGEQHLLRAGDRRPCSLLRGPGGQRRCLCNVHHSDLCQPGQLYSHLCSNRSKADCFSTSLSLSTNRQVFHHHPR